MAILVSGSLAYDTIMVFPDQFWHILADHILNVASWSPDLRREFGAPRATSPTTSLLGEDPRIMATVGHDFGPCDERLNWLKSGAQRAPPRRPLTAQAFITTDVDDNQITAFHPGAMSLSHLNQVGDAADARLAIVSPAGREGMIEHANGLAEAGIPHALGASALLHSLGLEDHVGDWDVNTDAGHDVLDPMFADLDPVHHGSSGIHADSKIQLYGASVELIVRMAIIAEGRIVHIPTLPRDAVVDLTGCGDAYRAGLLTEWRAAGAGRRRPGSPGDGRDQDRAPGRAESSTLEGGHRAAIPRCLRRNPLAKERDMKTAGTFLTAALAALALGGCAYNAGSRDYRGYEARGEQSVRFGVVESVREVRIDPHQTGVGTAGGAALGAIAGSNVGGGSGQVAGAIGGAILGGIIGQNVEARERAPRPEPHRAASTRASTSPVQEADEDFRAGDRVRILSGRGATRVSH
jgi:adenosine kinase